MRLLFDGDGYGSNNRNALAPILEGAGFSNVSTGIWETLEAVPMATVTGALRKVLDQIDALVPNSNGDPVSLDHVWIYLAGTELEDSTQAAV